MEKCLQSEIGKEWEQEMKENRLTHIRNYSQRPRVVSSNVEIETPEDIEGLKIRAPERDYYVETFKALGANLLQSILVSYIVQLILE